MIIAILLDKCRPKKTIKQGEQAMKKTGIFKIIVSLFGVAAFIFLSIAQGSADGYRNARSDQDIEQSNSAPEQDTDLNETEDNGNDDQKELDEQEQSDTEEEYGGAYRGYLRDN
jgi:hypothetical protein